jgi:hypothetical protein
LRTTRWRARILLADDAVAREENGDADEATILRYAERRIARARLDVIEFAERVAKKRNGVAG